jgi:hypothetical protein
VSEVVYTVRMTLVRPRRRASLIRYLVRDHLPALRKQRGFLAARLGDCDGVLVAEYRVRTPQDLKRYFKSAAPALRADFLSRFGADVTMTREIQRVVAAL